MSSSRNHFRCRLRSSWALLTLLLCGCGWDVSQFFFRPPIAERMRDNLSGTLRAPAPPKLNPDSFRFAMFGDPQTGARGTLPLARFQQDVPAKGIDFFCVIGDLTDSATGPEQSYIKARLDSIGVPYYCTLGNHDLYQANGWEWFKTTFGPSCYPVVVGDKIKILFLDSAEGMIGQVQFDWLESELKDDRFIKIVATHYPLYDGEKPLMYRLPSTEERSRLLSLLAKYHVHSIVGGHTHGWRHTLINGTNHFIAAMPPADLMDYGNPCYLLFTWAHDSLSWEHVEYQPEARP